MRIAALLLALILSACSRPGWHMTDISGAMPRLDFRLTSGGHTTTAQMFRGKVVALYFGYTHCPDVCPTTLANLTDMLGKVHDPNVVVLFVTVDPTAIPTPFWPIMPRPSRLRWWACAAPRTSWHPWRAHTACPTR
jgi:cytochrome oxidase Cu insertion factor (SCO1/SenC/PrrC family)